VTKPRHLLLIVAIVVLCALGFAAPASAHNSLVSSDPAEGATLDAAPTQMAFLFDKSVPLDTISVELIDASGVRTEVAEFAYGPSGNTEVIATWPALGAGEVTSAGDSLAQTDTRSRDVRPIADATTPCSITFW